MSANEGDWNPGFQRKKKRNRVCRGVPARTRKYYFWPCVLLVGLTVLVRLGVVSRLISLSGVNAITIHVSYNSLNPNSKWRSSDGRYLLGGVKFRGEDIYECQVSQEFWERVEENSHVSIPSRQCRLIDPAISVSGSLPLSNGGYGTIPATPIDCSAMLGGSAQADGQLSGLCLSRDGGITSFSAATESGVVYLNKPVHLTISVAPSKTRRRAPNRDRK